MVATDGPGSPLGRRALLQSAGFGVAAAAGGGAAEAAQSRSAAHHLPFVRAAKASLLCDFIGVNTHLNFGKSVYAQTDRVVSMIEDLGVHHIRDHVSPAPQVRGAFKHLRRSGVHVQGICSSLEDGASMGEVLGRVQAQFRRPDAVFSGFEPLNEPNVDVASWITPTRLKTQALHQARDAAGLGSIPILAPALARINNGGMEGVNTLLQADNLGSLAEWVDLGNMHVYPRMQLPSDDIHRFKQIARRVVGHKPLVCSEAGYFTAMSYRGTSFPTPSDVAGKYLLRLVMEHWLRKTRRVFLYELLDDYDPTNAVRESNFGLVSVSGEGSSATWTPKPAYVGVKNLLRIFRDAPGRHPVKGMPLKVVGPPETRSILFVKQSGVGYLALWRDVSSYDPVHRVRQQVDPVPVTLKFGQNRRVGLYDPLISQHRTADLGTVRKVDVPVGDSLQIVRIH